MYNLVGIKYGRLTPIKVVGKSKSHGGNLWECKCDCGNIVVVPTAKLRNGHTTSCGCYCRDYNREAHMKHCSITHGCKKPKLYRVWLGMRERCYYPKSNSYKSYGARGIAVCDEWLNDFGAFKEWALSNGYYAGLSIDRIDPDGNYTPSNCRWIPLSENMIRQRKSIVIEVNGIIHGASKWAKIIHVDPCRFIKMCKEDINSARLFLYETLKKKDIIPLIEREP